jgi:hypothetical protein
MKITKKLIILVAALASLGIVLDTLWFPMFMADIFALGKTSCHKTTLYVYTTPIQKERMVLCHHN